MITADGRRQTADETQRMKIEKIKKALTKPATKFEAGGFRPTFRPDESWIGKVTLYRDEESIPVNEDEKLMMPLLQLCLSSLPFVPEVLGGINIITVFISPEFPEQFEEMGKNWLIREYKEMEGLSMKELSSPNSYLKAFPLKPSLIENDYPLWDGGGVPYELEQEIISLEKQGFIQSYYDITEHIHDHKLGGYPSFCQPGIDFGEGFEFAFQVSSDSKINLNVVDNGSLMFAKNKATGQWAIYYDFY